ncbi:MAG: DnaJ domain-containing protein [Alphaproteobacteria bacterium]|nr:DnaJ domain-containing protein [Alphaproteobacteria bacterium]
MPGLIILAVVVLALYALLRTRGVVNPAAMARRIAGGLLLLAAVLVGVKGDLPAAVVLGIVGAVVLDLVPQRAAGRIGRLSKSLSQWWAQCLKRRSRFLELWSGGESGRIIAGPLAGRALDEFRLEELTAMRTQFDAASVDLLEIYLDCRFPGWRRHAQRNTTAGRTRPMPDGKMTEQEAHEILGLHPGASADEIRRAHRALIKKLHPDQGGSTYLAARVNDAKDILLSTHNN